MDLNRSNKLSDSVSPLDKNVNTAGLNHGMQTPELVPAPVDFYRLMQYKGPKERYI